MISVDAFILIGGRSTRFGSDKATYLINGTPMALLVADTIRAALQDAPITLIASDDEQFPDASLLGYLPIVGDDLPGYGAWSGLRTALANSKNEWTFVVACDLISLTPNLISSLAQAASATTNDIVIPRQPDGRLQPLCAFYRTANTLPHVDKAITLGGELPRLDSLANSLPTCVLEIDSDQVFLNANQPKDLLDDRQKPDR